MFTDREQQEIQHLQKRLVVTTWVFIGLASGLCIGAAVLILIGMRPFDLPLIEFLLPMYGVAFILFLYGLFPQYLRKFELFKSQRSAPPPVMGQFQRCLYFSMICTMGFMSALLGMPAYYTFVFFMISALGFYLIFPTLERVEKQYKELSETRGTR